MSKLRQKLSRGDYGVDSVLSKRMRDGASDEGQENQAPEEAGERRAFSSDQPIEPDGGGRGPGVLRWVFFLLIVGYTLFAYFHAPILRHVGKFLMVQDPVKRADLIVCTPDDPVGQCLSAAEFYHKGLSPYVYLPDAPLRAGLKTLRERGAVYPSSTALSLAALERLGVERSAIIIGEGGGGTVTQTAHGVKAVVKQKGFHALIIVTPPWRARLTRAVMRETFKDRDIDLMMAPSSYSNFKENEWWKSDIYLREVFFQYQRLFWHFLTHLW